MRKAFFFALICGVNSSALAQIEVSNKSTAKTDKWVMTANKLPGSTGRILIDNPAGSTWTIYIYAMADEKYITSYAESNNKGVFVLAPGEYKITLNNVPVLNVPVQKGYDTKIKCGIFDVEDETVWYLHDETGDAYYTSGDKPQKLVLPAGTYTYKIGGSDQRVVVKEKIMEKSTREVIETEGWIMTPLEELATSNKMGKLNTDYLDSAATRQLYLRRKNESGNYDYVLACGSGYSAENCPEFNSLAEGEYSLGFYSTSSLITLSVKDVPVKPGYETRPKVGFLHCDLVDQWVLCNESKEYYYYYNRPVTFKMALPVGTYYVKNLGEFRRFEIKDRETIVLHHIDVTKKQAEVKKWTTQSLKSETSFGTLNIYFPQATQATYVSYQRSGGSHWIQISNNDSLGYYKLEPGLYNIRLNSAIVYDVEIRKGETTRLKSGYLEIKNDKEYYWGLRDETKLKELFDGEDSRKVALPIGTYYLKNALSPGPDFYRVEIKDKESIIMKWPQD